MSFCVVNVWNGKAASTCYPARRQLCESMSWRFTALNSSECWLEQGETGTRWMSCALAWCLSVVKPFNCTPVWWGRPGHHRNCLQGKVNKLNFPEKEEKLLEKIQATYMNSRLICAVVAILPFHLAGVGEMLQHVCWHFGSERVPRKVELPIIQRRSVSFTEYIAYCARRLFINRFKLCSSSKELLSLFPSCEPLLSCLEPAACLLGFIGVFSYRMIFKLVFKLKNPHIFFMFLARKFVEMPRY